ncbi:Ubiquitin carboxyl-terminal hydrolase CYLD [Orchesella cincta]|uniref:Ubiquitin carboxyl-terminal hydrolase CYLD n=1 Tax=Orchesella cincta TaxID=48709 RepID=A0A1D2N2A6_ORCCI|nr:Ubiquitin carboxyl-terminal hydrolase CYLD [Orchesella cincta]
MSSNGELRKGDKVFLHEKEAEGTIRSAVFKGKRLGENHELEILLEGHRKSYSEDEVSPYKLYLRDHLGTSLIPESDYVISRGVVQWEEPTWEVGQEIYYKPEKRWATILNRETNAKGRPLVAIKLDQTKFKKEKVAKVMLNDLMADSIALRAPQRIQNSNMNSESDEMMILKVNDAISTMDAVLSEQQSTNENEYKEKMVEKADDVDAQYSFIRKPSDAVPPPLPSVPPPPPQSKVTFEPTFMEMTSSSGKQEEEPIIALDEPPKVVARKKSKKRNKERPATEYIQESVSITLPAEDTNIYQEPEPLKFKSCNNINDTTPDDDVDQLELLNYTNSLRSSARKLIQRQLAQDSQSRSLKLKPTSSRPHVEEVFKWNNNSTNLNGTNKILDRPTFSYLNNYQPLKVTLKSTSSNDLSKSNSQSVVFREGPDGKIHPSPAESSIHKSQSDLSQPQPNQSNMMTQPQSNQVTMSQPQSNQVTMSQPQLNQNHMKQSHLHQPQLHRSHMNQNQLNRSQIMSQNQLIQSQLSQSQNPLEYNFLPLSSSELVKQQLAVTDRVLQNTKPSSDAVDRTSILRSRDDAKGVSSDSSSHDNDSGRGSYPFLAESPTRPSQRQSVTPTNGRRFEDESPTPSRSPMSSDSTGNGNATMANQNSINRRYTKNRSPTRNHLQKKPLSSNDEPPAADIHIPHPFNPGNLSPVAGYGRGIQGSLNSSFADATLYALFACSNIFDVNLLYSKPGQVERGIKKEIREILRQKIVTPLRMSAYCKAENVTHLREAMLPLSSKMHSSLMEADEFLYLLFDSALNTESFIQFSNGTKDFMHQILARPKDRSKSQTVQFMLETSLGTSELKFKGIPKPALMLCMPRCKGRLVYYEAIIPSLHLNITRLLQKGPKQCVCEMAATLECVVCHQQNGDMALDFCSVCKGIAEQIHFRLDHSPILVSKSQTDEILNLHSIICTRGNRYVAFVKVTPHRLSPWLFFDPLAGEFPEVTLLEDFGKWLDSLEKQPGHYREFSKLHPLLKRIMTDSHIYIYSKAHIVETPNYTESLVI